MHKVTEFWSKARVGADGQCWPWIGDISSHGYGRFSCNGKRIYAHREAYERTHGKIPDTLTIDHLCRNRCCINPAHLEAVTRGENARRGESPSMTGYRSGTCAKGHPKTAANQYERRDRPGNGTADYARG